jgi:UDP-N-acetylmuramoyl-tripeptide--D-alanyl-D-alanine ligase
MPKLDLKHVADTVGGRVSGRGHDPASVFASGYVFDSRQVKPGDLFFALHGEGRDGHEFVKDAFERGAVGAVLERVAGGLPERFVQIVVPGSLDALQSIARSVRKRFGIPVVAISGSNGKTTTKEMLAAILSMQMKVHKSPGNFNNHIGVPMSILGMAEDTEVLIVELGSNHRGEIAQLTGIAAPTLAVITNVGPAHIGHFGSLAEIAREKTDLIRYMPEGGRAVITGDDRHLLAALGDVAVDLTRFGVGEGLEFMATEVAADLTSGARFHVTDAEVVLAAPGLHNVYNALAAMAAATLLGVSPGEAARALSGFGPVRMTSFSASGMTVLDDSYNANPDSVRAALALLAGYKDRRKVFVMGEMLELGDASPRFHHEVGQAIASAGIDVLVGIGGLTREATVGALASGMPADCVFFFESKAEAKASLTTILSPGDVVLVKGSRGAALEEISAFLGEEAVRETT